MDIYETLRYITKKALPKIKYNWDIWSLDNEDVIFQVAGWSNKVSDYVEDYFEKGLTAILKVIENTEFTIKESVYARKFVVAIANGTINYHSDIAKNKAGEACKLYKKNSIFREAVIEYAPHLCNLIPNLIAHSFFNLDFKTVKDVCDNCIPRCTKRRKLYKRFLEQLHDEFTYNHSFENLVTENNSMKYWIIAEYINQVIPELNFYQVRDGQFIFEIQQDIEEIKALKPLVKLVEKKCYWIDIRSIPQFIEFEYIYPNESIGDMIKCILEEYGETYEVGVKKWYGKISKKHIELLEMFSDEAVIITQDNRFLNLFLDHHTPSILSTKLKKRNTTQSHHFNIFKSIKQILHEHKLESKVKRRDFYAQLVKSGQSTHKWKSEAQLYILTVSLYPDAIFQYQPEWLGIQSLDIYIPSLSIAIEYQGIQHYKPVDHFGGEKHFVHRQANDRKKKELCVENGVKLIEWSYVEPINETNLRSFLERAVGVE